MSSILSATRSSRRSRTRAAAAGPTRCAAPITFSLASYAQIENLTLTGESTIDGTGNARANVITGIDGCNNLKGGGGDDDTRSGGGGGDEYHGGSGNDVIVLGEGE